MIVFVDFEHASGRHGKHATDMLAARTRITYRLEDLAQQHCHLVRYDRLDEELLRTLDARAIFVSGNSVTPDAYEPSALEPLLAIIRDTPLPVFGFCGGFQAVALAWGADVVPLTSADADPDDDTVLTLDDGRVFEVGYHPIALRDSASHPLTADLGGAVMRHAHALHVPTLPDGFVNLASTDSTRHQLAVHDERRIVATQFHPEYWTDEHPAGRTLIANFLTWSGVAASR
jgi:GMP synthase (glutamine-hydrolysing)